MPIYEYSHEKTGREWELLLRRNGKIVLTAYMRDGAGRSAQWDVDLNETGLEHPYDQYLCEAIAEAWGDGRTWTTDEDVRAAINKAIPPIFDDPELVALPATLTQQGTTMQAILDALTADPLRRPADMPPGTDAWLVEFLGEDLSMNPDLPWLEQVMEKLQSGDIDTGDSTPWDPYDEGYDDGPGDLTDCWHTVGHISTGQYRGTTVECDLVKDVLGAILIAMVNGYYEDRETLRDKFKEMATEEWKPPAEQDERDKLVAETIKREWQRLSPDAKTALLAELTAQQGK